MSFGFLAKGASGLSDLSDAACGRANADDSRDYVRAATTTRSRDVSPLGTPLGFHGAIAETPDEDADAAAGDIELVESREPPAPDDDDGENP